jgi:hypothetical protein
VQNLTDFTFARQGGWAINELAELLLRYDRAQLQAELFVKH